MSRRQGLRLGVSSAIPFSSTNQEARTTYCRCVRLSHWSKGSDVTIPFGASGCKRRWLTRTRLGIRRNLIVMDVSSPSCANKERRKTSKPRLFPYVTFRGSMRDWLHRRRRYSPETPWEVIYLHFLDFRFLVSLYRFPSTLLRLSSTSNEKNKTKQFSISTFTVYVANEWTIIQHEKNNNRGQCYIQHGDEWIASRHIESYLLPTALTTATITTLGLSQ